ncbi:hypothetical protein ES703_97077 [subsurface metagenome]
MKICEHESIRCPYCGEEDRLTDAGKIGLGLSTWHLVRCASCSGEFMVTCED